MKVIHGGTAVAVEFMIIDDDGDVVERPRQTFTIPKLENENFTQVCEMILKLKKQLEEQYADRSSDT